MNNVPIDYVQSVPPRSEAGPASSRSRDDAPRFDSHFHPESEAQAPKSPPAQPPERRPAAAPQREESATDRSVRQSNDVAPPADDQHDEKDQEVEESASASAGDAQPAAVVAETPVKQVDAEKSKALADAAQDQRVAADGKLEVAAKKTPQTSGVDEPFAIGSSADAQRDTAPIAVVEGAIDLEAAVPVDATAKTDGVQTGDEATAPTAANLQAVAADQISSDADARSANEPGSEGDGKVKSNKNTGDRTAANRAGAGNEVRIDDRASIDAATPDQAVEIAAADSGVDAETAAADKSSADGRGKKHIEPKATSTTEVEPTPGRPTVAAAGRAAALNPSLPVVANLDLSQPTADKSLDAQETDVKTQPVKPSAKEGLLSPFARLERGGPLHTHANRAGGNRAAGPQVDPARFVSRVARAVQTAHERGTPLQLRLSPPELGTMRLELTVRGDTLTASIETDNAHARQVLLDNLPALRDRLAQQHVRVERFDVDVRRDGTGDGSGSGGQPNTGPQEQGHHQRHAASHRTNTGRGAASQSTTDTPAPVRRTITNTSINVIA